MTPKFSLIVSLVPVQSLGVSSSLFKISIDLRATALVSALLTSGEANFVADAIAKAGHAVHVSVWERLPLCAADAFHFDQFGSSCIRGFSL